jgi:AraC family transcriptional regulator
MTGQGQPTPAAPALLTADDVSTTVVPGSAVRSSQERAWAGVEVVQRRHGTQALEVPPLGSHLLIIYQGRATVEMVAQIGEQQLERQLRPGGLALVPAGQPSAWQWRGTAPLSHDAVHIYLEPARLGDVAETGAVSGELAGVFGAYDPKLAMLGGAFLDELTERRVGEQLYVDALTTMLAVHLLRQYALERTPPREAPRGTLAATELQRLTEYVEAMLAQQLSLAELAALVHLSPHHFARVFKRSTGQSPHQYVLARRVERARQLLLNGTLPVAEIATLVGFADQSHLSAHLRRQLGVTPRQLRERARSS